MSEPIALRTVLADSPLAVALKRHEFVSASMRFAFEETSPVHRAFAPMVRRAAYDLSELAIVTALQAIAYGRPIVLLPAVVASRFQRGCLIAYRPRGVPAPEQLADKRIGVRAYTQTTGMWVRAHLAEDYGLPVERMHWLTREGAHVEEFADPACVEHLHGDASLPDQLRDGSIDAAILGNDLPADDAFVPVIADAAERDRDWWKKHGFMPINHMVAASADICSREPVAVREAYRLLRDADEATRVSGTGPQPTMFGFDALRGPIGFVIDACQRQGLLPRRLTVEEVLGPARELLKHD
jgi:4,5-dihydroxyphthalate decarboxylase